MIQAELVIYPSETGEKLNFLVIPRKGELVRANDGVYEVKGIVHIPHDFKVKVLVKELIR